MYTNKKTNNKDDFLLINDDTNDFDNVSYNLPFKYNGDSEELSCSNSKKKIALSLSFNDLNKLNNITYSDNYENFLKIMVKNH